MHFITPYVLTYLSFLSFSYLIGTYAFIHKNICDLYQLSKTELGMFNGLIAFVSTIGVVFFLMYTVQIKAKIVTYFTWGSIGYMLPFALIVLSSLVFEHPPKLIFVIIAAMIGFFRSIFFQSLLIMIKMHKEIYDRTNTINQHNYKLLTNVWSASYGMVIGFFICNWLQYQVGLRWEYLLIIGVSLKLITTTLLFFGLRSYLQQHQDQLIQQQRPKSKCATSTFTTFLTLINQHVPSKLYLINSTVIDALHIGFCYALPVFFYDSGYKGNEGYLTAIYSLAIIVGAYAIAISDYLLHKASEKMDDSQNKLIVKEESRDRAVVLFIFSVSLFFFVITLIVLAVLSFQAQNRKNNGIDDDSNVSLLMILTCALGFFFGGPLKSYFSYKSIKAMGGLQKEYQRRIKNDEAFKQRQQKIERLSLSPAGGFWDKICGHIVQLSSSLITTNRFLTYFMTIILFMISFYLMDKYLAYTMIFFSLIGVIALVFDIIQNWVAVKEQAKEKQQEERILAQQKFKSQLK